MKKIITILLSLFIVITIFAANRKQEILQQAVEKYENQHFKEALQLFQKLENENIVNSKLYFNIGNTHYRLGNLGNAILYYKKALKVKPNFQEAQENLKFALSQTTDKQVLESENFLSALWENILSRISLNLLAILSILFFACIIFLINLMIIRFRKREKTLPTFFTLVLILLLLLSLFLSFVKWKRYISKNEAVLLADSAIGYSGPNKEFTRVFTIHEGMIFKIEQQEEGWSLIRLANGMGGWIKNDTFKKILLAK
ncbi:MAG: tetratricopeptide repeat protein [Candidatus Cloacimonadota bacterium]|nr:tetratricopeptide repeat protein [Candidatus Cloacimonadota bacterium]